MSFPRLTQTRTLLIAAAVVAVMSVLFSQVPRGLDLQLAFTAGQFASAWAEWCRLLEGSAFAGHDPRLVFRLAVLLDFLFIPAYAVLIAGLYYRWRRPTEGGAIRRFDRLDWLVAAACLAAAFCDVLENLGLLWLSRVPTNPPPAMVRWTSFAAAFKWTGITFAVAFVVRAFVSGSRRRVLWLARYAILSMLLGTLPLVASSQGRDLILALGSRDASIEHRVFFYLTLTLWGLSVWYWTQVLLDAEFEAARRRDDGFARRLPRVLGAVTLALPGVPIALASNEWWIRAELAGGCAALAAAFWLCAARRGRVSPTRLRTISGFSLSAARHTPAATLAAGSLMLSLSLFVVFVFAPLLAGGHLGALAILFIAAANTVFFGSLAVFASESWRIRLDVVAFACAAAFSFWNDNHDVRSAPLDRELPTLDDQFRAWRSEQPSGRNGPVFLVAAEGGGLRAAFWTATVLAGLDTAASDFPSNLFAISGISGGTLGAAVYAGLRRDLPDPKRDILARSQAILSRDFLSPTLAKLVTGDFAQWFLPVPIHQFDRSLAIEEGFARAYYEEAHQNTLRGAITALMPDARRGIPAVLMNATIVDSGAAAIVAPFTWQPAQIPLASMYACWVGDCVDGRRIHAAPTLTQSIHNSARFTYVSPAGLVRDIRGASLGHVVDAGYYDPTGVQTALDLARALAQIDPSATVVPVYITNSTVEPDINRAALVASSSGAPARPAPAGANERTMETPMSSTEARRVPPVEILGELFAPVRALLRSRAAHGRVAIARQRLDGKAIAFGFCRAMPPSDGARADPEPGRREEDRPEPPLGWQLSHEMIERLQGYWNCPANRTGVEAVKNWLRR